MSEQAVEAVVIGASAGALEALSAILPKLSRDFKPAVLIVVHVPSNRRSMLADLFAAKCQLKVKEAEDKEPIRPGTIYFAPSDYHLLVELDKCLALSSDDPVLFSRPSIDVLFETAADAYRASLLAIVLTGANHDGARGAKAVGENGGCVLVQDPKTALATAMPEAALALCCAAEALSIAAIVDRLQEV